MLSALFLLPQALPAAAPVPPVPAIRSTEWIDFNSDGLVDIVALDSKRDLRVLVNEGEGRFRDTTQEVGLAGRQGVLQAAWEDFDGDEVLDVLLVASDGQSQLFRGAKGKPFAEVGVAAGVDLTGSVHSVRWLEVDGDSRPDLLVDLGREQVLYRNLGRGTFAALQLDLGGSVSSGIVTATAPGVAMGAPEAADPLGSPVGSSDPKRPSSQASTATGATPLPPATDTAPAFSCASGVDDASNPGMCIPASSIPLLGSLFPVSMDWFIDASTGYVGLGTLTPTERLDVEGSLRIRSGGIQFPDGTVQNTATLQGQPGTDALWQVDGSDMWFEDGRVGIGNSDPQARLDVSGNALIGRGDNTGGFERTLTIEGSRPGSGAGFASLKFDNYDSNTDTTYTGSRIRSVNAQSNGFGDLRFGTRDATGLSTRVTISASGSMGIGTTSPTQLLDVNGVIRARSGIEFEDGTTLTSNSLDGTQTTSIGPASFQAATSSVSYAASWNTGVWMSESNTGYLLAPLHLPQNARITSLTAYVYDTVVEDLRIQILRKRIGQTSSTIIENGLVVQSNVGFDSGTRAFDHAVNNENGAYMIAIRPTGGQTWPGTSDLALTTVVINWIHE